MSFSMGSRPRFRSQKSSSWKDQLPDHDAQLRRKTKQPLLVLYHYTLIGEKFRSIKVSAVVRRDRAVQMVFDVDDAQVVMDLGSRNRVDFGVAVAVACVGHERHGRLFSRLDGFLIPVKCNHFVDQIMNVAGD